MDKTRNLESMTKIETKLRVKSSLFGPMKFPCEGEKKIQERAEREQKTMDRKRRCGPNNNKVDKLSL